MKAERYRIEPGTEVDLSSWDPADHAMAPDGKEAARKTIKQLNRRLTELQELMYAQGKHKVLMVLQAMDTGGKDGAIRKVFRGVNPQGVKVTGFKKPTGLELAHDYLWRVHAHTPARGEIAVFNRSHYEDVLVVRVHDLVPPEVWSRRYEHINAFEKLLADEGTTILKFYLHISKQDQKERLQARIDEPDKNWKFAKGDLAERALWDNYMEAFEAVLSRTSTDHAPWFIVPANAKWYRDLVILEVLVETLEHLQMRYPEPEEGLQDIIID